MGFYSTHNKFWKDFTQFCCCLYQDIYLLSCFKLQKGKILLPTIKVLELTETLYLSSSLLRPPKKLKHITRYSLLQP